MATTREAGIARTSRRRQGLEIYGLPDFVPFQLCRLVDRPPEGLEWLHEIKFDGYRMQVRVRAGRATVHTRNGHDWTTRFPALVAFAGELPDCIIDGELCALNSEGYSDFSRLRSAIARQDTDGLVLFAFDILYEGADDLRPYAQLTRKARLRAVLERGGDLIEDAIRYVEEVQAPPAQFFEAACRIGWEGVVSKHRGAAYREGRGDAWVKSKCRPELEVVIGGWRTENGRFRSLLAGVREGDKLRYVGRVHTGYSDADIRELLPRLKALETPETPFHAGVPPRKSSDVHWAKPVLVAAVEMAEMTAGGRMRQASFKGLRAENVDDDLGREPGP